MFTQISVCTPRSTIKMLRVTVFLAIVGIALGAVTKGRPEIPQLDGRIVGGRPVSIQDHPYQLSLQYYSNHICGASIISSNYAVTAAHCTDGLSAIVLSVRAGSSIRGSGGQVVRVSKIYQHPNYNSRTTDYDISILVLASSLSLSSGVLPIRLPVQDQNIPAGTSAVCSGWGALKEGGSSPSQLQAVDLPVVSQAVCKSAYGLAITTRMLCAGHISGDKDACQGDSGGPLVAGGQLIGVVSWGYGCARPNYPGVYASVPNLRDYIKRISGI